MKKGLILTIVLSSILSSSFAVLSGSGTEAEPYLIQNLADFNEFRSNFDYRAEGVYSKLMTDIDLSGQSYTSAIVTGYFYGIFDGNNRTIVNAALTSANGGLFYYVYGTVKNLQLTGIAFSGNAAAGICGKVDNVSSLIENCYVQGTLSGFNVGGITSNNSGTITGCFADCQSSGTSHSGNIAASNYGIIENCYSSGTLTATTDGYFGGLVGYNVEGHISKCYSEVELINENPTYYHCAFVGRQTGTVRDCFWNADVNPGLEGYKLSTSDTTATGLTAAQMLVESNFTNAGWDFAGETANGTDDIWMMPESGTGPVFSWIHNGTYCLNPQSGDVTGDCVVDLADFALMAANWLGCGYANQQLCP
ncbi:The GLUG motif [Limihaloglobus sulfuriphilus]|uniref:The GLUG motif n=1 Tax=Limihaloglobus sulfuriphilus TaxID=1851148 RepID=A0A1R7T601_9BACT|nr:hypothetical protein [Limihaloglobus sulfuriphilus]AQQ72073.1 The GLUG motif [Limihaloglobus sulfuriphilus]